MSRNDRQFVDVNTFHHDILQYFFSAVNQVLCAYVFGIQLPWFRMNKFEKFRHLNTVNKYLNCIFGSFMIITGFINRSGLLYLSKWLQLIAKDSINQLNLRSHEYWLQYKCTSWWQSDQHLSQLSSVGQWQHKHTVIHPQKWRIQPIISQLPVDWHVMTTMYIHTYGMLECRCHDSVVIRT